MKRPHSLNLAFVGSLGCLVLLSSCSKPELTTARAPDALQALTPREEREISSFCRDFADAVSGENALAVELAFDFDGFISRVLDGVTLPVEQMKHFRMGLQKGMAAESGGPLRMYLGRNYRFLQIVEVDGEPHLLFRYLDANQGFDYHRYRFTLNDGEVMLNDMYAFVTGENLSDSLRRAALPTLTNDPEDDKEEIFGNERNTLLVEHSETLATLSTAMESKDYASAEKAFDQLPEALRSSR